MGIHKTACSINLISRRSYCVETNHLIWGAYRLTGFFAVWVSTYKVFWGNYTIAFFVSLELPLLDCLRLLPVIFKYSACLIILIKLFSVLRIVLYQWARVWSILTVMTLERCSMMSLHGQYGCSWTTLFLLESLSFSNMLVNLIQYHEVALSCNNWHSVCEFKYCNLPLQSHYHNNIFAYSFFFITVVSYLYYF